MISARTPADRVSQGELHGVGKAFGDRQDCEELPRAEIEFFPGTNHWELAPRDADPKSLAIVLPRSELSLQPFGPELRTGDSPMVGKAIAEVTGEVEGPDLRRWQLDAACLREALVSVGKSSWWGLPEIG